jgi:exportin-5
MMDSLLSLVGKAFDKLCAGELIIRLAEKYSKTSIPVLRVDAHFTVVEAALKGYMKWRSTHGSKLQEDVRLLFPKASLESTN